MIKDDKCEITQINESSKIKETTDKYIAKPNYKFWLKIRGGNQYKTLARFSGGIRSSKQKNIKLYDRGKISERVEEEK